MAGVRFGFSTGEVTTGEGSLTKTIMTITAAANRRVHVHQWSISYKGVTAGDLPHQVRWVKCDDAGTVENALTASKFNTGDTESIGAIAATKNNSGAWTDEPSVGSNVPILSRFVPVNGGASDYSSAGFGPLVIRGGETWALQVVNPTDTTICIAEALCEE